MRLAFIFLASAVSAMHYGILQGWSAYSSDLAFHWNLQPDKVNLVFTAMNLGATSLSFLPGIVFDRYGTTMTGVTGCILSVFGLTLAEFSGRRWQPIVVGFFIFGIGAAFLNFNAILSVLKAFPQNLAGAASAGVLVSLALGSTFQALIFRDCFVDDFGGLLVYMVVYSIVSAILPMIASSSAKEVHESLTSMVEQPHSPSSGGSSRDVVVRSPGPESDVSTRAPTLQKMGLSFASVQSSSSRTMSRREVLLSPTFLFLAAVFAHPIAFCYSFLGSTDQMGYAIGMVEHDVASLVAAAGLSSAIGRILSMPSDCTEQFSSYLGNNFFFMINLATYSLGLYLLSHSMEQHIWMGTCLIFVGYGGLMGLAPGQLRSAFGGEYVGFCYGLLYEILAVTFVGWNVYAPLEPKVESFQGWLSVACCIAVILWLFSVKTWLHAGCMVWCGGHGSSVRSKLIRGASQCSSPGISKKVLQEGGAAAALQSSGAELGAFGGA